MLATKKKRWWNQKSVTIMFIPERTPQVHKVVVPVLLVKSVVVVVSLMTVLLVVIGMDYLYVLSRIGETKALKGENFQLRQEIQTVRNKVDSMEATMERVRNYAKKLQMMLGQGEAGKSQLEMPSGPIEVGPEKPSVKQRRPSSREKLKSGSTQKDSFSFLSPSPEEELTKNDWLEPHVEKVSYRDEKADLASITQRISLLQSTGDNTESQLNELHAHLIAKSAMINATPSLLPIRGWISSSFGYRRNPYDGGYRMHSGVDIVAEPGTPVRAPAHGTVIFSGYREGYGKVIVLDHGYGLSTLFAHNSSVFVAQGNRVKRGETISQVGNTGRSTGPHLHYEIRKNGIPVNPTTFFSRNRF